MSSNKPECQDCAVQQGYVPMGAVVHPDNMAVDALASAMKAKLAKKRAQGFGGWDTDCTKERLSELLRGHVDKGDPVNVANFCAFLLARDEGIAAAQQGVQPDVCAQEVFNEGISIGLFDIPKHTANAICSSINAATGARVDWHYIGGRVHLKALPATPPAMQVLEQVKQAVRDYHFALDTRQHGGVAAGNALDAVQDALGMRWQQGQEAATRATQAKQGEQA